MSFATVFFDRGENVSLGAKTLSSYPSEPGYWAEYWTKTGNGPSVWVGPFVSEQDALASAVNLAEFKRVVYNPLPPLQVQEVFDRDSNRPYGIMGAGSDIQSWASWGKSFGSIEARDAWLTRAGFQVSETIGGFPVEWSRA